MSCTAAENCAFEVRSHWFLRCLSPRSWSRKAREWLLPPYPRPVARSSSDWSSFSSTPDKSPRRRPKHPPRLQCLILTYLQRLIQHPRYHLSDCPALPYPAVAMSSAEWISPLASLRVSSQSALFRLEALKASLWPTTVTLARSRSTWQTTTEPSSLASITRLACCPTVSASPTSMATTIWTWRSQTGRAAQCRSC